MRHDYYEGMIAVKEKRQPQWNPAQLEKTNLQDELAKNNCIASLAYPRHNPRVDFSISPYKKYVLPTLEDVQNVRRSHNLTSDNEVYHWFMRSVQGKKYGLKQRLESILKLEGSK